MSIRVRTLGLRALVAGLVTTLLVAIIAELNSDAHVASSLSLSRNNETSHTQPTKPSTVELSYARRLVIRLDPRRPLTQSIETTVKHETEQGACARHPLVPLVQNLTAVIISAIINNKQHGPELSLVAALPNWTFEDEAIKRSAITVSMHGSLGLANSTTKPVFEFTKPPVQVGHPPWRTRAEHDEILFDVAVPQDILTWAASQPDLSSKSFTVQATFQTSHTVTSADGTCTLVTNAVSAFGAVPVDFPIRFHLRSFTSIAANIANMPLVPELVICFGPIYSAGHSRQRFFEYWIELIEYHRHLQAQHLVFYVDFDKLQSCELTSFLHLYANASSWMTLIDTTKLSRTVNGHLSNQVGVINDCVKRVSSIPRFVYVCDIDEWLWPTRGNSLPEIMATLAAYRAAHEPTAYQFAFAYQDDHLVLPDICPRLSPEGRNRIGPTIADANRWRESQLLKMASFQHFHANMTSWHKARTKAVSITTLVTWHDIHYSMDTPCTSTVDAKPLQDFGLYRRSRISIRNVTGLAKLHMRLVPFRSQRCYLWEADEKDVHPWQIESIPYFQTTYVDIMTPVVKPLLMWFRETCSKHHSAS